MQDPPSLSKIGTSMSTCKLCPKICKINKMFFKNKYGLRSEKEKKSKNWKTKHILQFGFGHLTGPNHVLDDVSFEETHETPQMDPTQSSSST